MSECFYKFPHTPHMVWLGQGAPRDDKILAPVEVDDFLAGEVVVEEKVDGANVGISLSPDGRLRAQSRGNYLAPGKCHEQWNLLWPWLSQRQTVLEQGLQAGLILFGEWCYVQHSVPYDALPDWFLGFDVYEIASGIFWSVDRRNEWLKEHHIIPIPEIARGLFSQKQLLAMLSRSRVGHLPMEGIYLRREQAGILLQRAKIVGNAFKQQIEEHWTRRPVVQNHLSHVHV